MAPVQGILAKSFHSGFMILWPLLQSRTRMKTYDIEIQRLKSAKHNNGLISIGIDALVQPRPARDESSVTSYLHLPVEDARTLLILLKQQITELDKLQPRSRRSGRC
jgi:hypothetical protein